MVNNENNDIVIDVQNLFCLAGSNYLLNNINWQVKRGEQWVVFGRNGCGKTTLLSIIAGYKNFSGGTLKVFGQEFTADNILDIRKKIGWISSSFFDKCYKQESVLNIVLSGLFGTLGTSFNVSNKDMVRAVTLLEDLGLKEKIKSSFDMLSKGERQNVLIARAFMTEPEILILDEPGTGLDVIARENLLNTINTLSREKNVTTIYVTHYPEEILPSFDKCLLLRQGTIYRCGETAELMTSAEMSEFVNFPVEVMRNNGRFDFTVKGSTFQFILNGGAV